MVSVGFSRFSESVFLSVVSLDSSVTVINPHIYNAPDINVESLCLGGDRAKQIICFRSTL